MNFNLKWSYTGINNMAEKIRKDGECAELPALACLDIIQRLQAEIHTHEKALQWCVVVPGNQYDALTMENEDLKQLEKQYARTLGNLAQLCDVVCPWVIAHEYVVGQSSPEALRAAHDIMEYVNSVRP